MWTFKISNILKKDKRIIKKEIKNFRDKKNWPQEYHGKRV